MPRISPHQRAWIKAYGPIPEGFEIDHRDGNKRNNAPDNLRLATRHQNNFNRAKFKNNQSGEKGVLWDKANSRWQVRVFAGAIRVYANASAKISAILAARLIRRELHGEFSCERTERIHHFNPAQVDGAPSIVPARRVGPNSETQSAAHRTMTRPERWEKLQPSGRVLRDIPRLLSVRSSRKTFPHKRDVKPA